MRKNSFGKALVYLLAPSPQYLNMGCSKCGRILETTKDKFIIALVIKENGCEFKYFLGVDPPMACCGKQHCIFKTFEDETEAMTEVARVNEHLRIHQSTQGLVLHSIAHRMSEQNLN